MRCFNHHDLRAVGTCKQCGKGLCPDCVVDLGHGLACRGEHELAVAGVDRLVKTNVAATQRSGTVLNWFLWPAFYLLMGAIFTGFELTRSRPTSYSTLLMGVLFLVFGVVLFALNLRGFRTARANG